MKLLLLGHYAHDVVHGVDGSERLQRGGLHRVIERLSALASHQDRIIPVFGVQGEEHPDIVRELTRFPNVDTGGIYAMETPSHRVHYYEQRDSTRVECVKELAAPVPFERIKKYLDVDGVLINMMSGVDLRLETLDEIRMTIRGTGAKLHLDVHNLTMDIGAGGERVRRPVPLWRRWGFMVDTLQMNEEEIAGLTAEPMSEQQTIGHLLTLSVKAVLVTRGAAGASLYTSEHKHVLRKDVPAPELTGRQEPGSGDLFGAAFFLRYCVTGDAAGALDYAIAETAGASDER
jgi:sugar/nucleoside kinase (ribokinase family)